MFCLDLSDGEERYAKRLIDESLVGLELASRLPLSSPMAWKTVREVLLDGLAKEAVYPPFPSGGITFCGMVPLRALPFRVVCLLGMNDEMFPRKEGPGHRLSLIREQKLEDPKPGYQSLAEDDRLLFLQCLMAGRDVFYISYIGRDLQTGRELKPSQVVLELWAYLKKRHGVSLEDVMAVHPIQPFHPSHLDASSHPRVLSLEKGWFSGETRPQKALLPLQGATLAPMTLLERLEFDTLKRFFKNPTKYFLNERLNVDLKERDG
jgi:exodeoxyribonuclease V gamma subunit